LLKLPETAYYFFTYLNNIIIPKDLGNSFLALRSDPPVADLDVICQLFPTESEPTTSGQLAEKN